MDPRFASWAKIDPFSPPHWRWVRAQELLKKRKRYSARTDDARTGEALRYLRARTQGSSPQSLQRRFPAIHRAEELFGSDPTMHFRSRVEARFLAGQTPEEIAVAERHPVDSIEAYADLFYDVRHRLRAPDSILKLILRLPPEQYAVRNARMLMILGFYGGPIALDLGAPVILGPPPRPPFETVEQCQKAKRHLQFSVVAAGFEVSPEEFGHLAAEASKKMKRIDKIRAEIEQREGTFSPKTEHNAPQIDGFLAEVWISARAAFIQADAAAAAKRQSRKTA
jgi:hypothetical protein